MDFGLWVSGCLGFRLTPSPGLAVGRMPPFLGNGNPLNSYVQPAGIKAMLLSGGTDTISLISYDIQPCVDKVISFWFRVLGSVGNN